MKTFKSPFANFDQQERSPMKKHTKRVVAILKQVLLDIDELKGKGVEMPNVIAYTAKHTTPDIQRHDVEMMIAELECECTHPDGPYTECFAPETICPDQLMKFNKHSIELVCNNVCVNHIRHGLPVEDVGRPMTINTLSPKKESKHD